MRRLLEFSTGRREELIDITRQVDEAVNKSGIRDGLVSLYVQGATAALMIQENWDESVQTDVVNFLRKLIPPGIWLHDRQDDNGDAHLKNWTLIYPDGVNPRLAPAYDIVSTRAYILDEEKFALNLDRNKNWYKTGMSHFERWTARTGAPWRAIEPALKDTLEKARSLWPLALKERPMNPDHKATLLAHWRALQPELKAQP